MTSKRAFSDPTFNEAARELEHEEQLSHMVPVSVIRPIIDRWIGQHDSDVEAYSRLAAASDVKWDTWRKRLTDGVFESPRGTWRGWWSHEALDLFDVDFLLTCADLTQLWNTEPELAAIAGERTWLSCEDCGVRLGEANRRALDLMRPDPEALHGWVWNKTTGRWVYRPKNAAAGGRRFRLVELCRKCAGEALRLRAAKGTVSENGVRRALHTKERVAPKRGGRPRLLTDEQILTAHLLYIRGEMSMLAIAKAMVAGGQKGTVAGLNSALFLGFDRLGLPKRSHSERSTLIHKNLGHQTGRRAAQIANKKLCSATTTAAGKSGGKPCGNWARPGTDLCWNHTTHGTVPRSERRQRCEATTHKGRRCHFSPLKGSEFCRWHDDSFAEQRQQQLAHVRSGQDRALVPAWTVRADLEAFLEWQATLPRAKFGPAPKWRDLVAATGMTHDTFNRIMAEPAAKIRRETVTKIHAAVKDLTAPLPLAA